MSCGAPAGLRHNLNSDVEISLCAGARRQIRRRNSRSFSSGPLSFEQASGFFEALRARDDGERVKYPYPSAGALYAVRSFVLVRPLHARHGIVGIGEGGYYYDPLAHVLHRISAAVSSREMHRTINRPVFDQSSMTVFLIADLNVIAPVYGIEGSRMAGIEAGMMTALMEQAALELTLGICHLGGFETDAYRSELELCSKHIVLHAMAVGRLA